MRFPFLKGLLDSYAENGAAGLFGVTPSLAALIAGAAAQKLSRPLLVITASSAQAEEVLLDYRTFFKDEAALFGAQNWQNEKELENLSVSLERMECYSGLLQSRLNCVVAPLLSLLQDTPDPQSFQRRSLKLKLNEDYPPDKLLADLFSLGYERADMVQFRGEFAQRGGLVDIFPLTEEDPLRIEYFGDEITSIRRFDAATQRSVETGLGEFTVFSASERNIPDPKCQSTLLDFYRVEPLVVFYEFAGILREWEKWSVGELAKDFLPNAGERMNLLRKKAKEVGSLFFSEFATDLPHLKEKSVFEIKSRCFSLSELQGSVFTDITRDPFSNILRCLSGQLETWKDEGWKVTIYCATPSDSSRLRELLCEAGAPKDSFKTAIGSLSGGFLLPEYKEAVLLDDEIFRRVLRRPRPSKIKARRSEPIDNLATIKIGSYVVHLNYGIGVYEGIKNIKTGEGESEMIAIRYANDTMLYVSLGQAALVERYITVGKREPELDTLGSGRWKSRCRKAEKAVLDLASELLERQAKRKAIPGFAAMKDSDWQTGFEKAFPYAETLDQKKALEEIKKDMESPAAMDRLICGDVGFGKTEVALRAAFKAVMSGRQVAVLVPTTILAHQHLKTFTDRVAHYPVKVEELSRFVSPKRQKEIVKALAAGEIDIIIGTHRLLSKDIAIPKLGLVVIDEEQRFGVRHKEKLKRLSALTDVISLSATPIPRTLYQSLTGLRDMSVINTPPVDRLPVITNLIKKNGPLIKDAVRREIMRGGQVFYLHNRVETIEAEREKLEKLLPGVRIAVGHGQMPEEDLEEVIQAFVDGKYDLLLCTMIVESGIDMPNVNTIIIDDAHRFGLSDLYQLRGRVGRADRQAYAYLIVPNHLSLDSQARQRLRAIMENTALGSGYQIAMKDLEIRGAGNILGEKQSGHITAIGFGLYCKLLNRAISLIKEGHLPKLVENEEGGEESEEAFEPKVKKAGKFDWRRELPGIYPVAEDVTIHLPLSGDIPESYIQSPVLRLDLFRRLSSAGSLKDIEDLKEEMRDRFGEIPKQTELLLDLTEIKLRARARGIDSIESPSGTLVVRRHGKIYNPFGKLPKVDLKNSAQTVMVILAFLSRIDVLPGFQE